MSHFFCIELLSPCISETNTTRSWKLPFTHDILRNQLRCQPILKKHSVYISVGYHTSSLTTCRGMEMSCAEKLQKYDVPFPARYSIDAPVRYKEEVDRTRPFLPAKHSKWRRMFHIVVLRQVDRYLRRDLSTRPHCCVSQRK